MIPRLHRLGPWLLLLAAGCKKETPRPDPAPPSAPASAPTDGPGAMSRAAPPGPQHQRPGLIQTPSRVDPGARPLHVAVWRPEVYFWPAALKSAGIRMHLLDGNLLATHAPVPFVVAQGKLKIDGKIIAGSVSGGTSAIVRVEGRWPDALWLLSEFDPDRQGGLGPRANDVREESFRKRDGKWKQIEALPAIHAVSGDIAVGVVKGELKRLVDPGPTLRQKRADGANLVQVGALAALPSGEWMALGYHKGTHELAVERWESLEADSVVQPLPASDLGPGMPLKHRLTVSFATRERAAIGANGPDGAYLALLDGQSWIALRPPDHEPLAELQRTADGAVWLRTRDSGHLWRFHEGSWVQFKSQPTTHCDSERFGPMTAVDANTAYLGGYLTTRFTKNESHQPEVASFLLSTVQGVMHGAPPASWLRFCDASGEGAQAENAKNEPPRPEPSAAATAATAGSTAAPATASASASAAPSATAVAVDLPPWTPFTPGCKTPFVALYDVSKSSPADFSFPSTRKALSSFASPGKIKLVEYLDGRRRLGVIVDSAETGEALVKHILEKMKDEAPQLVCYSPRPGGLREITLP